MCPEWVRNPKIRNTGCRVEPGELLIPFRTFTPKDKRYPRLTISLRRVDPKGLRVSINIKENPKAWWLDVPLPLSLISELTEMLTEFQDAHLDSP